MLSFLLGFLSCCLLLFILLFRFDSLARYLGLNNYDVIENRLNKFAKSSLKVSSFQANDMNTTSETALWLNNILQYIIYGILSNQLTGKLNIVGILNDIIMQNKSHYQPVMDNVRVTDFHAGSQGELIIKFLYI